MNDERDLIIDSLLDEVVGGEQPPDLTRRILGAHHASVDSVGDGPTTKSTVVTAAKSHVTQSRRQMPGRRPTGHYAGWATLAIVLMGAGLFAAWAWQQTNRYQLTNQPPVLEAVPGSATTPNAGIDTFEGQEDTIVQPGWADPDLLRQRLRDSRRIAANRDLPPDDNSDSSGQQVIDSPKFERLVRIERPSTDSQVVNFINAQLKSGWKKLNVTPTRSVGDMEWFARATHTVLGRVPTAAEKKKFEQLRDREAAINELLSEEEFARHWAKRLTDVLVGGATSSGFDQSSLEQYLFESFNANKPYDELAFDLVTAQGSSKTDDQSHNPAVNFLLAYQVDSPSKTSATDKVCQVFLGRQMQCLRCHDHPANKKLSQQSYWDIAAYFTQMHTMATPNGPCLVDRDYAGDDGKSLDEAELFYLRPDLDLVVAYPNFPGQSKSLSKSGRISEINRRVELANSIVASEDFSMAAVNRIWRQVFRSGFTLPVDDMGEHNTPSQSKLLRGLASEFKNSGYDVRSALRWMLRSAAFDRKVRDISDSMIASSGDDGFSSFAGRDLINHPAIEKPLAKLASSHLSNRPNNPTLVLGNMGADDNVPPAAAAKARQKINARHRERLLSTESESLLARLAKNRSLSNAELVEHLFFSFVGRAPNEVELRSGKVILDNSRKVDGLIEIGQIILSSEEFKTQH